MNKKITIITSAIILGSSLLFAKSSLAVVNPNLNIQERETIKVISTVTPTPTATVTLVPLKRVQIKVALKKTNALKEIDRRLANLNKLIEKINNISRITAAQKQSLVKQVSEEISALSSLRGTIESETDATALQAEKKSLTDAYKIYGLFLPKIEIIAHADKIITVAKAMDSKTEDVNLKKIIQSSIDNAQKAIDMVIVLTPDQFPEAKTTLSEARDLLRDARTNLNTVFLSLKTK
jgi:hypothetical protein